MAVQYITTKKYMPVGQCIYCGSRSNLGDEHIIPYSLGGGMILPDASCYECGKVTSYINGYAARHLFDEARAALNIRTRHRSHRATKRRLLVTIAEKQQYVDLPINDYPNTIALPNWAPPNFLTGAPEIADWPLEMVSWTQWIPQETLDRLEIQHYRISTRSIKTKMLIRLLAQIAHADATAMIGHGSFIPFLSGVILDEHYDYPRRFVGCLPFAFAPFPQPVHQTKGQIYRRNGVDYYVVTIRLFPEMGHPHERGTPVYVAVVGQMKTSRFPGVRLVFADDSLNVLAEKFPPMIG
jgi:hypothetical protein